MQHTTALNETQMSVLGPTIRGLRLMLHHLQS